MIGQGSPNDSRQPIARQRRHRPRVRDYLVIVALALCAVRFSESLAIADDTDLGLRIAWGGGELRQWNCEIHVSDGSILLPQRLALEADTPGSTTIRDGQLFIEQRSARAYDGVDFRVTASPKATLSIVLTPTDGKSAPHREIIKLEKLVSGAHRVPIDEHRNQLLLQRKPGDRVRFDLDHESLVFAPGDEFVFSVLPHQLGLPPDTGLSCELELVSALTGDDVWSDDVDRKILASGQVPRIGPFAIRMPAKEGVYDLKVRIESKGFTRLQNKPVAKRNIQLVVVAQQTPATDRADWEEVVAIDPANVGWWDRVRRLPQLKLIPGFGNGPITHGGFRKRTEAGASLVELDAGSWHAFPLPIDDVGVPHVLEVEYAAHLEQTLGISIIEPNAAGMVPPIGLDSGVDVTTPSKEQKLARHRLIFWPRSTAPLVILTNRRSEGVATFGKLRVLAGPKSLQPARAAEKANSGRTVAAYFDKPLFAENFGAAEALEPGSRRTLDDWNTFYTGGRRMVEYLRHVGYNAALVSVLNEGSSLFPSKLLEPTPKYDSGTFFSNGQDPFRKDVLELLFRLFDRENLTLIPALQFSAPLPELERLRQLNEKDAIGIDQVDWRGVNWLARRGSQNSLAPRYNPLDRRVQQAILDVIDEVVSRYAHHPSFGGISLQMGPDTHVQMPGETWGYDPKTIARFGDHLRLNPVQDRQAMVRRIEYLRRNGRDAWLRWRADELATFHLKVQQQVAQHRRGAKLYLAGANLFGSARMQSLLRPTLPQRDDFAKSMLAIGLNSQAYRRNPNIVLLNPQRIAPLTSVAARRLDIRLQQDPRASRFFDTGNVNATLIYHDAPKQRLPSFDRKSPFGAENTHLWLVSQLSPSKNLSRKRFVHSIAASDAQMIFDGGWMLPLGQEDSLVEVVEVIRALPAQRFQSAAPQSATAAPVVIRTLRQGERTYIYLVNDSPWEVTTEVQLQVPRRCRVISLGRRQLPPIVHELNGAVWRVKLKPYDLVAAVLSAPNVRVLEWTSRLPDGVANDLRQKMNEVRAKAKVLTSLPPLDVLPDRGFERFGRDGAQGWVHSRSPSVDLRPDLDDHCEGKQSLRMTSRSGVAWVRSLSFEAPKTGRVAVIAKLRIKDSKRQPPLRLALEYLADGVVEYQFAEVGAGRDAPRLNTTWEKFVFHVDNLPATGVTKMRVGFDLMGAGQVWIDDVEVFDRWFDDNEHDELLKNIALAGFQLDEGNAAQCQRFLDGYWPQFLNEFVTRQPRVARNPVAPTPSPQRQNESKSVFDRMKGWLPKRILPF